MRMSRPHIDPVVRCKQVLQIYKITDSILTSVTISEHQRVRAECYCLVFRNIFQIVLKPPYLLVGNAILISSLQIKSLGYHRINDYIMYISEIKRIIGRAQITLEETCPQFRIIQIGWFEIMITYQVEYRKLCLGAAIKIIIVSRHDIINDISQMDRIEFLVFTLEFIYIRNNDIPETLS